MRTIFALFITVLFFPVAILMSLFIALTMLPEILLECFDVIRKKEESNNGSNANETNVD